MQRGLPLLILALLLASPAACQAPGQRPNVLLIITDDLGYGDIGSYGAPDIRTPAIDRLAAQGTRFTDFYANAPLCTPTRAALISGRYQQRAGLEKALSNSSTKDVERGLPVNGRSLPQLLRNNGYATALVGKWHLGYKPENSPNAHGFDYFWGFKSGYVDYYQHTDGAGRPDLFENSTPVTADGYMTDLTADRALQFIRDNRTRPFFMEVAFGAPHWPYQPPGRPSRAIGNARHLQPSDDSTGTRADYIAMVESADAQIGRIVDLIDSLGIGENTLIIFTNDNGGEWLSRNTPLFHRKWTLWEGGIRVPTIMRWTGRIPAGKVTGQVGTTMDISATILTTTRSAVPKDVQFEGMDLMPIVQSNRAPLPRTLFWRTEVGGFSQRAVRDGNYKLLVDGTATMLFDVSQDLGERQDLAAQRQDVAQRLRALLNAWERDVGAVPATPD